MAGMYKQCLTKLLQVVLYSTGVTCLGWGHDMFIQRSVVTSGCRLLCGNDFYFYCEDWQLLSSAIFPI